MPSVEVPIDRDALVLGRRGYGRDGRDSQRETCATRLEIARKDLDAGRRVQVASDGVIRVGEGGGPGCCRTRAAGARAGRTADGTARNARCLQATTHEDLPGPSSSTRLIPQFAKQFPRAGQHDRTLR
jgi:hypothetical protein